MVAPPVLAQPEMEKRRSPLEKIPPLRGGDFPGMWGYPSDDHFPSVCSAREGPPALLDIGSMSRQIIPQHGCILAQPASVSPGSFIVAPPCQAVLEFRFARHPGTTSKVAGG